MMRSIVVRVFLNMQLPLCSPEKKMFSMRSIRSRSLHGIGNSLPRGSREVMGAGTT